jgi:hypothetical protein
MANIVNEGSTDNLPPLYGRRYPWKKWFALKRVTLVKGKDFNGRTDTFCQQCRNVASNSRPKLRVRVQVSHDGNEVTLEVRGKVVGPRMSINRGRVEVQGQRAG